MRNKSWDVRNIIKIVLWSTKQGRSKKWKKYKEKITKTERNIYIWTIFLVKYFSTPKQESFLMISLWLSFEPTIAKNNEKFRLSRLLKQNVLDSKCIPQVQFTKYFQNIYLYSTAWCASEKETPGPRTNSSRTFTFMNQKSCNRRAIDWTYST